MSYSQYSSSARHNGHESDLDREIGNSTNSGSFSLSGVLSTIKHKRRMGTVKSSFAPQRLSSFGRSDEATPSQPATGAHLWGSAAGSVRGSTKFNRRPVPIPMPELSASPQLPAMTASSMRHVSGESIPEEDEEQSSSRRRSRSQPPPAFCDLNSPPRSPQLRVLRKSPTVSSLMSTPKLHISSAQKNVHSFVGSSSQDTLWINGKPYNVLKKIGKGGSSVVFDALDEDKNLRAIKKVDLSEADEAQRQAYKNEITLLTKLKGCDRIIELFDHEFRPDEDLLFVVMERGDTDLSVKLKKNDLTSISRKYFWSEMLEAVQVIHNEGVIHSDLKPANFLLVKGTLKLIDFGIASAVQSDKTSVFKDNLMGTFNFMSPEAIEDLSTEDDGKPRIKISRKSDIWSLGCILYNMTYGKMPFGEIKIPIKKLEAITNPKYPIPYPEQNHDPNLVDSIQRCLVRDPQKRASVEELLSHPYLRDIQNANSENERPHSSNQPALSSLSTDLLSQLNKVLTPNTRKGLSRALEKLSTD